MNITWDSSVTTQQRQWAEDALARCTFPFDRVSITVEVQRLAEPPCAGHSDYMCTQTTGTANVITIRTGAEDPEASINARIEDADLQAFFEESFIHELGHAVIESLADSYVSQIVTWFRLDEVGNRRTGESSDWSDPTEWNMRIQEAAAEFFKDTYLAEESRYTDQRTKWDFNEDHFPDWQAMMNNITAGGGGGGDSALVMGLGNGNIARADIDGSGLDADFIVPADSTFIYMVHCNAPDGANGDQISWLNDDSFSAILLGGREIDGVGNLGGFISDNMYDDDAPGFVGGPLTGLVVFTSDSNYIYIYRQVDSGYFTRVTYGGQFPTDFASGDMAGSESVSGMVAVSDWLYYMSEGTGGDNFIGRMRIYPVAGADRDDEWFNVGDSGGSELTSDGDFFYWTRGVNEIYKWPITGPDAGTFDDTDPPFYTDPDFFESIYNIAVDDTYVYWADYANGVGRINKDGTGAIDDFITLAGITSLATVLPETALPPFQVDYPYDDPSISGGLGPSAIFRMK